MTRSHFRLSSVGCIVLMTYLLSSCARQDISSSVDLIPVQLESEGKWSMINRDGQIVYSDEFKNEPSLSINGVFSVEEGKEGTYALYLSDDKPRPIKGCESLKSVGVFNEGLIPVVYQNSRITLIDKSGEKKFELEPVNGKEIIACDPAFSDGMLGFEAEGQDYGFVDTKGNVAIAAKYAAITGFSEGLALVATRTSKDTDSNLQWQIINKKGETVFKLKKDFEPQGLAFKDGILPVKDTNDRILLYNTKGEFVKLPSKAVGIKDWNDKVVVFTADDDEAGVMDHSGEVIIRAKYDNIMLMPDGRYLCDNDDNFQILNREGEQEARFEDYRKMEPLINWGIFAKEKSTIVLLDFDGKAKCKEEFEDVGFKSSASGYRVRSDYFDPSSVANALTDLISDKGVGKYELGQSPSSYLRDDYQPSDYSWTSNFSPKDLKIEGFRYEIEGSVKCTESIARYSSDYGYDYSYQWNPESKIGAIMLEAKTEADWTKKDCLKIYDNLKAKGFKDVVAPSDKKDAAYFVAVVKKGRALVCVVYHATEETRNPVQIGIFDITFPGIETEILQSIRNLQNETSEAIEEAIAVEADSVADTIVAY